MGDSGLRGCWIKKEAELRGKSSILHLRNLSPVNINDDKIISHGDFPNCVINLLPPTYTLLNQLLIFSCCNIPVLQKH